MTNCPFCKIAAGIASASLVYEDDNVLAFLDINPSNIGHTLIVPRDHWENIYEIPENILTEIIIITKNRTRRYFSFFFTMVYTDSCELLKHYNELTCTEGREDLGVRWSVMLALHG